MSKAEKKAMEKYPPRSILIVPARGGGYYADSHMREGLIEGYHQAEKDTIEKAMKWLESNLKGVVGGSIYIEDFLKAMRDE